MDLCAVEGDRWWAEHINEIHAVCEMLWRKNKSRKERWGSREVCSFKLDAQGESNVWVMTSKRLGKIVAGLHKWDSEYEVGVWNLTYQMFTGWEILLFLWHYMKQAIFQGYSRHIFNIAAVSRSADGGENALRESGHAWHLLQNYAAKSPSPFLILRTSILLCKETVLFSCCCL